MSTVFDQTTEGNVPVYDSLYTTIDSNTVILLEKMFGKMLSLELVRMQRQCGSKDCGFFALRVCTAIAHGIDPSKIKFDQYKMRHHLITCFESNNYHYFLYFSHQSVVLDTNTVATVLSMKKKLFNDIMIYYAPLTMSEIPAFLKPLIAISGRFCIASQEEMIHDALTDLMAVRVKLTLTLSMVVPLLSCFCTSEA